MLNDIWYLFFADNPEVNLIEKLKIIRPLVALSEDPDDICVYNFWAKEAGIPEIKRK